MIYSVDLCFHGFITIDVEADDEESAEDLAHEEFQKMDDREIVANIEEVNAFVEPKEPSFPWLPVREKKENSVQIPPMTKFYKIQFVTDVRLPSFYGPDAYEYCVEHNEFYTAAKAGDVGYITDEGLKRCNKWSNVTVYRQPFGTIISNIIPSSSFVIVDNEKDIEMVP